MADKQQKQDGAEPQPQGPQAGAQAPARDQEGDTGAARANEQLQRDAAKRDEQRQREQRAQEEQRQAQQSVQPVVITEAALKASRAIQIAEEAAALQLDTVARGQAFYIVNGVRVDPNGEPLD